MSGELYWCVGGGYKPEAGQPVLAIKRVLDDWLNDWVAIVPGEIVSLPSDILPAAAYDKAFQRVAGVNAGSGAVVRDLRFAERTDADFFIVMQGPLLSYLSEHYRVAGWDEVTQVNDERDVLRKKVAQLERDLRGERRSRRSEERAYARLFRSLVDPAHLTELIAALRGKEEQPEPERRDEHGGIGALVHILQHVIRELHGVLDEQNLRLVRSHASCQMLNVRDVRTMLALAAESVSELERGEIMLHDIARMTTHRSPADTAEYLAQALDIFRAVLKHLQSLRRTTIDAALMASESTELHSGGEETPESGAAPRENELDFSGMTRTPHDEGRVSLYGEQSVFDEMSEESLRRLGELDFVDEPLPDNEHPLETVDRIIDSLDAFLRAERISNTNPKRNERLDVGIADTTNALQFMRELRAKLEKQPSPTSDAEM
ncbi:MAG: hypothetical protein Q7T01_00825, partial [bacterium]|nr:hypothetical protein [bacterium]